MGKHKWVSTITNLWGFNIESIQLQYHINRDEGKESSSVLRCIHCQDKGFSSVQFLSCVWVSATPWTAARQASVSITNSQSPPKPISIESMMPSNHLILCRPLLLLPSSFSASDPSVISHLTRCKNSLCSPAASVEDSRVDVAGRHMLSSLFSNLL